MPGIREFFRFPLALSGKGSIMKLSSNTKEGMIVKRSGTSMLEGPLLPNIILYTIPIILTSILQLLFNAADLIIVGRFCGSVSVAAVGATSSITNLMVNLIRFGFDLL